MNGIDAVTIATGNDWRAVEAGAHAFAARSGQYSPLAVWRRGETGRGEPGVLVGRLELPMALGTVGGTLRVHPAARLSLQMLGVTGAGDLAQIASAVGLSNNLSAARARHGRHPARPHGPARPKRRRGGRGRGEHGGAGRADDRRGPGHHARGGPARPRCRTRRAGSRRHERRVAPRLVP